MHTILTENLPDFTSAKRLYLDVETRANTEGTLAKKYSGLYPHPLAGGLRDEIAGFAFTVDNDPRCYYVPMRHRSGDNCDLSVAQRWLADHVKSCKQWINHNVVFDASFLHYEGAEFDCELVDTLTLAKVHYSDRMGHGLKDLCRDWCDLPMEEELEIKTFLKEIKSNDYSKIPIDILGRYACMDVRGNRTLYEYLLKNRAKQLEGIWETEIKLAPVIYDMHMNGIKVNRPQLEMERRNSMRKMIFAAERIEKLANREFTDSNKCVYDILHNQHGMPVLVRNKDGNPTYDYDAMQTYLMHPDSPTEMVQLILDYREESKFMSAYIDVMLELADKDSRIHPNYNAVVRTGRMSASNPNIMGQSKRSKLLFYPDDGFISCDYSQIEYRLIVHYINDYEAVKAYNENPDTDFHQWVADLVGVSRDLAKRLNFGMAYGAGKTKVMTMLAGSDDIRKEMAPLVDQLVAEKKIPESGRKAFLEEACKKKAAEAFNMYHDRFPGIKKIANRATEICRSRGYVFNPYGRRRYIDSRFAYKAFNSIVQGFSMDILKERMVFLSPRYNEHSREIGLKLVTCVHDELLSDTPEWNNPEVQRFVQSSLESPDIELRVPLRTSMGASDRTWAEAA